MRRGLRDAEEQGLGSAFFTLSQVRHFATGIDPFGTDVPVEVAATVGLSLSICRRPPR